MALVTGTNIGQQPIIVRTTGQILEPGNTTTVDTDLQTVSDAVRQNQLQVPAGTTLAPDISSAQGSGSGSGGSVSVTNFPTTQQVAVVSAVGVGTEGDGTTTVNRIAGRDRQGVTRFMLTDEKGRQKISHAQPDIVNADLTTVNDALVISMDSLSDAMMFTRGAAHAGFALAFEYSPDTTAVPGKTPAASPADGNWYPIAAKNAGSPTTAASSASGTLTSNGSASFELSAPAASAVRARVTAVTSGTLTVGGLGSTAARPTSVTTASGASVSVSNTPNVSVTNTPAVTVSSGTLAADLRPASGEVIETTTALAANASYVGASRDHGATVNARPTRYRWTFQAAASALGSVAHLALDESTDGTTWRQTQISPLPLDGTAHTGEWSMGHLRYYRIRVVNGATAMTSLVMAGLTVRGDGSTADTKANLPFPLTPVAGTVLAASAAITGPALDLGVNHQWDRARMVIDNQDTAASGVAAIQVSQDGSRWRTPIPSTSVAVNTCTSTEVPLGPFRYVRGYYSNGSTAATASLTTAISLVSL